jgi:hypothetical protein
MAAVLAIASAGFLLAWLAPPVFTAPNAEPVIERGKLVLMTAIENQAHPEIPISVET